MIVIKILTKVSIMLLAVFSLSSCASYGKKENNKTERDSYDRYKRVYERDMARPTRW